MFEIETKRAGEEDLEFLFEVYASSRMSEVRAWGWKQNQIMPFLKMQYQCQQQSYLQHFPNLETKIIFFQNEKVGKLLLADLIEKQVIVDITILPNYQNKGIGGYVLSKILINAIKRKKNVELSVFYANEKALRLYERLGFQKVFENQMYLLMEWKGGVCS